MYFGFIMTETFGTTYVHNNKTKNPFSNVKWTHEICDDTGFQDKNPLPVQTMLCLNQNVTVIKLSSISMS
jgi:hypothetical protein